MQRFVRIDGDAAPLPDIAAQIMAGKSEVDEAQQSCRNGQEDTERNDGGGDAALGQQACAPPGKQFLKERVVHAQQQGCRKHAAGAVDTRDGEAQPCRRQQRDAEKAPQAAHEDNGIANLSAGEKGCIDGGKGYGWGDRSQKDCSWGEYGRFCPEKHGKPLAVILL